VTEVSFCGFLHLDQDHGGDFLCLKFLAFTISGDLDNWLFTSTLHELEWPQLGISLDGWVVKLTTDQTLSIEDGVFWITSGLVLGSITDKTFGIGESNVRRSGTVTLIVCNDFDSITFHNTDTGVSRTEIDTDCDSLSRRHLVSMFDDVIK